MQARTIVDLLEHHRREFPDRIAFIDGNQRYTYAQFADLCDRAAYWLQKQGIGQGDRVAVWLVNRMEWLALLFGLSALGATLVTVNTRYRAHEVSHILEESEASMLILEPDFRKIDFMSILRQVNEESLKHLKSIVFVNASGELTDCLLNKPVSALALEALADNFSVPRNDVAHALCILFTTSGTTSAPKLVMHTQRTISAHSQHVARAYRLEQADVILLAALPFCGVFGFNAVFGCFAAGQPVVLMDTFDAAQANILINEHQVTHLFGSDEMFSRMLEHTHSAIPFPSARVFGFAAFHAGFDRFGKKAWDRKMPMYGLYGSSEVQALFSLQSPDMPLNERLRPGGIPANPQARLRIRDPQTGQLLGTGKSGVIEIYADTNFVGYLNNQAATDQVVDAEGYFCTGDLGYLREDGSLVYQTRQGDAIRLAGFLVNPAEIEDVLKLQSGVDDAQVVGVEVEGQNKCVAFVITSKGCAFDENALRTSLGQSIAAFKLPVRIWEIDAFPTTMSSNGVKIQRRKLREMAQETLG
jgi:fatty-acyl-CoA synthase